MIKSENGEVTLKGKLGHITKDFINVCISMAGIIENENEDSSVSEWDILLGMVLFAKGAKVKQIKIDLSALGKEKE